jgi:hypothetical protein
LNPGVGEIFPTRPDRPRRSVSFCTIGTVSLPRGYSGGDVALTTYTYLGPRLKQEYSYTSAPSLCLHGLLWDEIYIYYFCFLH